MNELALFAGAGGGLLGSRLLDWRTVCAVEIDPYCREIILRRQEEGHLEPFPVWDDVRTFDGCAWRGAVDIVTAGFPCQAFSLSGPRTAKNFWPETFGVIRDTRPTFALLENVAALLSSGYYGTVLADLASIGMDVRWGCFPACEVSERAHCRNRLFALAHANSQGPQGSVRFPDRSTESSWWESEPELDRVANGVANRVDRLRALGNGQVPAVVRKAWEDLT